MSIVPKMDEGGREEELSSEGRWMLDTIDPYELASSYEKYPEQVTLQVETWDGPSNPLSGRPAISDLVRSTADDDYCMLLMWSPSAGARTVVGRVAWSWEATAERTTTADQWTVTAQELDPNPNIVTPEEPVLSPSANILRWQEVR